MAAGAAIRGMIGTGPKTPLPGAKISKKTQKKQALEAEKYRTQSPTRRMRSLHSIFESYAKSKAVHRGDTFDDIAAASKKMYLKDFVRFCRRFS